MKGKNKHKKLKPIMKKSMLAALGLGIALPVAGSLPQANATAPESNVVIATPVLNDDIFWLNHSSKDDDVPSLMPRTSIVVKNNRVKIDLSSHFPSDVFSSIDATSSLESVVDVFVSRNDNDNYEISFTPNSSGQATITLSAIYTATQEKITDQFELYISKKGDLNGDDKVDSSDAIELYRYLRNMEFRRGFSYVDMNKADIDRDGELMTNNDMDAFMQGYTHKALGAKDKSYILTFKQVDDAPYALNGAFEGTMKVGQTITGTYTHLDVDGDEKDPINTKYQWYTASDANGTNETIIEGAISKQYNITENDANKYLILKITPVSSSNQQLEGKTLIIRGTQAVEEEGPPPPP